MENITVSFLDIITALSDIIDMVSPRLDGHHKRVAYIAKNIAGAMELPLEKQNDIIIGCLLHDCGALSLKEKLDALSFDAGNLNQHAEQGYRLIGSYRRLSGIATLIRYHHVYWKDRYLYKNSGIDIPVGSYVIHLADRIDTLIDRSKDILEQSAFIRDRIFRQSGFMFNPELVDIFLKVSGSDAFWKGIQKAKEGRFIGNCIRSIRLDYDEMLGLASIIEKIIDFRSSFTSTHSRGVAAVAVELAKLINVSADEYGRIKIAGHLHDMGKLAIPREILEKNGQLSEEEYKILTKHPLYSYNVLKNVKGFETINKYASLHHEKLDGTGYPFGLVGDELSMGSRVIAVADIFTAITEDRPYRKGMQSEQALKVMEGMAAQNKIDPYLVFVLKENFKRINEARRQAQKAASEEYQGFSQPAG